MSKIHIGLAKWLQLLPGAGPGGVAHPPDWFNSLELAFDVGAATEMLEDGPVGYFLTWYADSERDTACHQPRVVRLNGDRRFWRSELLSVWQQEIVPHFHVDMFFADPEPSRTPWQHHLGHILLV